MKRIVKLTIILSLLAPVCRAQKIETVEEFKVFYDSIFYRLKPVEKDANSYIGKPFSEFVKLLGEHGLKISQSGIQYDNRHEEVYGLSLYFSTWEILIFKMKHDLREPIIYIDFTGGKSYEEGLRLTKKYEGYLKEEVEEFYSDAVIKSIVFSLPDPDKIYEPVRTKRSKK